ncbi:MFS transporter [Baekduia sp. Peel2402]|uniref:MFS transporter n=1 Tax=Baekduia sp. Peel2402 TaxID=3458296 RepID=UPI00403E5122
MPLSPLRHRLGFWSVAFAFLTVMAFSTVPSPLYGIYQQRDGFSSFTITLIYGAYAIGVVAALLLAGHVSDWHGRRRVLLPAVAISIVSTIVFLLWRDVPGLVLARIVNGLSVGVVAATATAWLTELHLVGRPGASPMRAQLIATGVNLGGLGLGPLVSGALAQWAGSPLTVPYLVFLVALVVAVAVVALTPETRERLDPLPAYRVQRVSVPEAARGQFFNAAWGAFVAFGALGLFTGLSATFLVGTLHETSHLLAGVTVFALFAAGVVAQVSLATATPRRLLTAGSVLMVAGLALTALAVWLPSPSYALFLAGGALTGGGAGAVFKGSVGTVIAITEPHQRAEALAGVFLAGYVGLSVPVVGAGVALQFASPRDTLLGFAIIEVIAIAAIVRRMLSSDDRDAATRQELVTA